MFKIALWNVGENSISLEFNTGVDTLVEAEVIAVERCRKVTGVRDLQIHHHEDLEYGVFRGSTMVGSFSIESL